MIYFEKRIPFQECACAGENSPRVADTAVRAPNVTYCAMILGATHSTVQVLVVAVYVDRVFFIGFLVELFHYSHFLSTLVVYFYTLFVK